MQAIFRRGSHLWNDTHGVTTIEYAVISGLLVVAIVAGLSGVTANLGQAMSKVAKAITTKGLQQ
jgi:Flp pilus assembly pilin Flp